MKMRMLAAAAGTFAAVTMASPAWSGVGDKVTGGAETITAAGVTFSMTVNGITTNKGLKGNIHYSRESTAGEPELFVHASVECLHVSADGMEAEIAGPAMIQANTIGASTNDWFAVAVQEGGTGSGDSVRARFVPAGFVCNGENSFPGDVMEGEFKIRPGS